MIFKRFLNNFFCDRHYLRFRLWTFSLFAFASFAPFSLFADLYYSFIYPTSKHVEISLPRGVMTTLRVSILSPWEDSVTIVRAVAGCSCTQASVVPSNVEPRRPLNVIIKYDATKKFGDHDKIGLAIEDSKGLIRQLPITHTIKFFSPDTHRTVPNAETQSALSTSPEPMALATGGAGTEPQSNTTSNPDSINNQTTTLNGIGLAQEPTGTKTQPSGQGSVARSPEAIAYGSGSEGAAK